MGEGIYLEYDNRIHIYKYKNANSSIGKDYPIEK